MPLLLSPANFNELASWWHATVGEDQTWLAVFVMFISTEITFWSVNLFFFGIERLGLFKKYKIHTEATDLAQFKETLVHKPITYLVDIPIYWLTAYFTPGNAFDPLPSGLVILRDVAICTLAFDLMFYCWHRSLHTSSLWKYHKKHHEIKVTYACANDHEDMLEVSGNILWKMIPPIVLGSHIYTICVYRSLVKFFALLHHSGYELPIFQPLQYIPLMSSPADHDFHHYEGHSNYGGVLMVWDHVFGTRMSWADKAEKKGRALGRRKSLLDLLSVRETVALTQAKFDELPTAALQKMAADSDKKEDANACTMRRRRSSIIRSLH